MHSLGFLDIFVMLLTDVLLLEATGIVLFKA